MTAAGAQLHDAAGLKAWADASVQTVGRLRTKQVRLVTPVLGTQTLLQVWSGASVLRVHMHGHDMPICRQQHWRVVNVLRAESELLFLPQPEDAHTDYMVDVGSGPAAMGADQRSHNSRSEMVQLLKP